MAVNFQHPFQCVQYVQRPQAKLLLVSAGPRLYSYSAETGQRLASWPQDTGSSDQEPPEKKRKVSSSESGPLEEGKAAEKNEKAKTAPAWSNIPIVTSTSNGEYAIAVTGEDKCIRVFQLQDDGSLNQLSERAMPKRPSSIALTSDETTILCADKFGDVHSLPLIPTTDKPAVAPRPNREAKLSHPAATNLTVHTKGNLRALEQQLLLASKKKEDGEERSVGPSFEHHLLLGHVSLLTDMVFVSLPSETHKRTYILTADRDEHIRVSRGPPQAHVIETYCLGHTAFISKICVPQYAPEYLISGGGDNYLVVWNWAEGRALHKVPLVENSSAAEVVVRGIWATTIGDLRLVLVALDGSPKLLCFTLEADGALKPQTPIDLTGNVLAVTPLEEDNTIFISVDSIRTAGSIQEWRASSSSLTPPTLIEAFRPQQGSEGSSLAWEPALKSATDAINAAGSVEVPATTEDKRRTELNDLLYAMSKLRKTPRGGDDE
ncbi:putative tRNA methyltransferase [Aspergillus saccharolyticus JOP 1030-1]|uniref:Guanine-N(7)--methyltransferase subunit trm82 n=1 Tax=Aspergillus saccharolyticus JOP 1030-1 TaxID=1450539 RepID=A0A318ZR23_9EURO|nr:guanine-N(7)--methyltransferase subunit trm82 [Aspergillus saccharolyticus JOP 1030-1]PYH50069.1 guanine-N(7)--methyltransferase subunit trm82 [Aspergillus saccharolyticus JOP 1030-1]